MSGKQRVSKERQELEEQSRRALMGLGITNETAIHGVLAETLGVTAPSPQPKPSVTSSPSTDKTPPPSETPPAASEIPPSPPRAPVAASATTAPSVSLETPLSLESEGERVHNLRLELLDPSPDQPRLQAEPDPELLENIRLFGVRTPIHVRPVANGRYHIVAGGRGGGGRLNFWKGKKPARIRQEKQ